MEDIDKAFKEYLMKESCDDCVQTPEYKRFFVAGAAWQKDKTIGDVLEILRKDYPMRPRETNEYEEMDWHLGHFIHDKIDAIKALSEGKR